MENIIEASAATVQKEKNKYKALPILFAMLLSGFIGLFGETALNVAITPLMSILEVGPTTIQWLTTGYLLVLGILVPVSGLLLQWFTTRQLFTTSLLFYSFLFPPR